MINYTQGIHPLKNRVDPFGQLISTRARGHWMGNRGLIHDINRQIIRAFRLRAWIICQLEFRNRHRIIMSPNQYTELFFLDEATAFSAGHRPCAECRRQDYNRFKTAWISGNPSYGFNLKTPISKIDEIIHRERIDIQGKKRTHLGGMDSLPPGCFISHHDRPFVIKQSHRFAAWTAFGYEKTMEAPQWTEVTILTPKSLINAIQAGYTPQVAD
jgi:hypothetical protein